MNKKNKFTVSGNIVDVIKRKIYQGTIYVNNSRIEKIVPVTGNSNSQFSIFNLAKRSHEQKTNKFLVSNSQFILPGLIDAHIHVESSMVIPSEFARAAVIHGTVAVVADPHEIANVLGIDGVKFMIDNSKKINFKFYFGAPSCVPATDFDTSGNTLDLNKTGKLLKMKDIKFLSEMMNFPGVLNEDINVMNKIGLAKKYKKPVDGHAPGLRGEDLKKYIKAGISTDHESSSLDEAREKIKLGMKLIIREGSAAKNFDTLIPLIEEYPEMIMLCSDDKHPDDLLKGHINLLVKKAINKGYDIFDILRSCTYNPVKHYKLNSGLLQKGDAADFIIADNLNDFNILSTYINGQKVAENKCSLIKSVKEKKVNNFHCKKIAIEDIRVPVSGNMIPTINVIEAMDGQLLTKHLKLKPKIKDNKIVSDIENDILKIVVLNRYNKESTVHRPQSTVSVGFVKGFGIKSGAIASSISHDSHNIIAVGSNDINIVKAINRLINLKGGIAFADDTNDIYLQLPVAGIMSNADIFKVSEKYKSINSRIQHPASSLQSPFMTLSFMALLVIPELKISDKGLFDVNTFRFISLIS
jgi:adenine deaminase